MDKYPIRRKVVRELIEKRFDGRQTDFAEAAGFDPTTVSRWFSDKEGRKNIGEQSARKIEQRLHLKPYTLDDITVSRVAESTAFYGMQASIEEVQLGQEWGKLDEPARTQIRTMIETLVASQIRQKRRKPVKSTVQPSPSARRQ